MGRAAKRGGLFAFTFISHLFHRMLLNPTEKYGTIESESNDPNKKCLFYLRMEERK